MVLPAFFSVFVVFVCFSIDVDFGVEFMPAAGCATTGPCLGDYPRVTIVCSHMQALTLPKDHIARHW
jgi:hypothetical protein